MLLRLKSFSSKLPLQRSKVENEDWVEVMQNEGISLMPIGINAFFTEEEYVDDFGNKLGPDVFTPITYKRQSLIEFETKRTARKIFQ